jgi:hypothetical protein
MPNAPAIIPETVTPKELAKGLGASHRRVADDVRTLGCYCKIGAKVVMRQHHVEEFMEAMECHSKSTGVVKSGITEAPSPEGDYAALQVRRTKPSRNAPRQKSNPKSGDVILMAREQR